jgi:hypothetical protein
MKRHWFVSMIAADPSTTRIETEAQRRKEEMPW